MTTTRRTFLSKALLGSGAFVAACRGQGPVRKFAEPAEAEKIGEVPFLGRRRTLEKLRGEGLRGRYSQDLTRLTEKTLITPNERFYVRTRCPDQIDLEKPWKIRVRGNDTGPSEIAVERLLREAEPMGVHLLECSGNRSPFGLIGAADWKGVELGRLLDELGDAGQRRILVSGFDQHSGTRKDSPQLGASWAFTRADIERTGAFLATHMNGVPLPVDHGLPVRLVVPGWYGCTCIKWVDSIHCIGAEEPATPQMREFARRTHQDGVPRLAREFRPAEMDLTAMPVRVEKWRGPDGLFYVVAGVLWGGRQLTDDLEIRFGEDEPFVPVQKYTHRTNATWTLWTHVWKPTRAGRYRIRLQVDDPKIRTRRLDSGWYARSVRIDAV